MLSLSVGPEMLTVGIPSLLFIEPVVNIVVDAVDVAVDLQGVSRVLRFKEST